MPDIAFISHDGADYLHYDEVEVVMIRLESEE